MKRRSFAALVLGLTLCLLPSVAWAGSYLNRAALLLHSARAERDMVRPRVQDKELVEMAHRIASARSEAARRMQVPKEVAAAHPHLLLVLENTERAFAAALDRNYERFAEHIDRARAEDGTFRAIV
ncbi:MAG: hypothetical protein JRI23_07770, partial [Deltaproteobacteria bacterium]|nr:hypothetical protein [Deltaproteobacteria bacterium]MBW2531503.1 hypothetical protein [Deltaproteobacteria bacterium]